MGCAQRRRHLLWRVACLSGWGLQARLSFPRSCGLASISCGSALFLFAIVCEAVLQICKTRVQDAFCRQHQALKAKALCLETQQQKLPKERCVLCVEFRLSVALVMVCDPAVSGDSR